MRVDKRGILRRFVLLAVLGAFLPSALFAQRPGETEEAYRERMRWFQDAKFGMFVHWGAGCMFNKKICPPGPDNGRVDLSWGRPGERPLELSTRAPAGPEFVPCYDTNYRHFNPTKFDPDSMVAIAKNAGMRYIVLTAKHHEGFAMFDTKQMSSRQKLPAAEAAPWDTVPYGIMSSPYGKNILKMYAEATRRAGLHFGIYYSERDWYNWDYGKDSNKVYDDFMKGQIEEIIEQSEPEVIFWDSYGLKPNNSYSKNLTPAQYWKCAENLRWVESLRPNIIQNNRSAPLSDWTKINRRDMGAYKGDYDTPEGSANYSGRRVGEGCMKMNGNWGYVPNDNAWQPVRNLVKNIVRLACSDGNFLLNLGPTPEGTFPERGVDTLKKIGKWMEKYGESIYGTRKGPIARASWGGTTIRDSMMYVFLYSWKGTLNIGNPKANLISYNNLTSGKATITQAANGTITVKLNAGESKDDVVDIFALKMDKLFHDSKNYAVPVSRPMVKTSPVSLGIPATFRVCGDRLVLPAMHAAVETPVSLFDLSGRQVAKGVVKNGQASLRRDFGVRAGVYIVRVK